MRNATMDYLAYWRASVRWWNEMIVLIELLCAFLAIVYIRVGGLPYWWAGICAIAALVMIGLAIRPRRFAVEQLRKAEADAQL